MRAGLFASQCDIPQATALKMRAGSHHMSGSEDSLHVEELMMTRSGEPKPGAFSVFRSAAEEAKLKKERDRDNEGGHMSSTAGRVVCTSGAELPYKVILSHEGGVTSEHAFSTMQEAEAFIRRNTPLPPARSTLRDHDAGST